MILLDANILLRMSDKLDTNFALTQRAVFACRKMDAVVIAPQTLFEFWAVATRAVSVNGVGMDIQRARQWLITCKRMFHFLPDPPDLVERWTQLVTQFAIRGFRAHDVRYVAWMQFHGISHLMTYNIRHFSSLGIEIIDPENFK